MVGFLHLFVINLVVIRSLVPVSCRVSVSHDVSIF
jgi:hypothetical protein